MVEGEDAEVVKEMESVLISDAEDFDGDAITVPPTLSVAGTEDDVLKAVSKV